MSCKPIDKEMLERYVLRMLAHEVFCVGMRERIIGYYHHTAYKESARSVVP